MAADTIGFTTGLSAGEKISIALNGGIQADVVWADGSKTTITSTGLPTEVELKSVTFSIESESTLTSLYIPNAGLTAIDLSDAGKLEALVCPNNQLTTIDLTDVPNLKDLDVQGNQLTSLTLSGKCNGLVSLNCAYNRLTTLRPGTKPQLTTLICAGNQLTSLTLTSIPSIQTLWCQDNQLTTLSLSSNSQIRSIYAFNNQLSNFTAVRSGLARLWLDQNQLTALDLSDASALEEVIVDHNQLTTMTWAAANEKTLKSFYAHENALSFRSLPSVTNLTAYAIMPQNPYALDAELVVNERVKVGTPFVQNAYGQGTLYALNWCDAETGKALEEGVDVDTYIKGTYTFLKEFPNGVYAEVTSDKYPDVTLRTVPLVVSTTTGITQVTDGFNVTASAGTLNVKADAPARVQVFGINGAKIIDRSVGAGNYSWKLDRGVYLVNGTKILIP